MIAKSNHVVLFKEVFETVHGLNHSHAESWLTVPVQWFHQNEPALQLIAHQDDEENGGFL